MFLNKTFPYNPSFRTHLIIGIVLGVLVLFLLFFLKPFNVESSKFPHKTLYFIVFGLITTATYILSHLFSTFYFKKIQVWKYFEEIIFYLVFITLTIIVAFFYIEVLINKNPKRLNLSHFIDWYGIMFSSFGTLLIVFANILRKRYNTVQPKTTPHQDKEDLNKNRKITLSGSLKKESLQVSEADLVYIKSENNYIRVFYFEERRLKEKLLRSTLFNVKEQLPSFIKVHRSYIVNPSFIASLKGNKQNAKLGLSRIDNSIPISKPFFEQVNTLFIDHKLK